MKYGVVRADDPDLLSIHCDTVDSDHRGYLPTIKVGGGNSPLERIRSSVRLLMDNMVMMSVTVKNCSGGDVFNMVMSLVKKRIRTQPTL